MAVWRSKLGNVFPKADIDRCDREHHAILKDLRKQSGNEMCAECGATDTLWASVNLGVFLCVRCADVHRGLGTHISKVKGLSGTYLWGPDEISMLQNTGNIAVNRVHLALYTMPVPDDSTSKEELLAFCRKKYEQKLWYSSAKPGVTPTADKPQSSTQRVHHRSRPMKNTTAVEVKSRVIDFNFDEFFDLLGMENNDLNQPCAPQSIQENIKLEDNKSATIDTFLDVCLTKRSDVAPKKDEGLLWDSDHWFSMQGI